MKIIIKTGNWWQRILRGMYNTKTQTITIWNTKDLFNVLSHELGHHNFQMKYEKFLLWRKILSKIIQEHEIRALIQEGNPVEVEI